MVVGDGAMMGLLLLLLVMWRTVYWVIKVLEVFGVVSFGEDT